MAVHPWEVAVALSAWSQLLDENLSSVKATFQGYANAAAPNHLSFLSWQFHKEAQNIICCFKRSQVEYFKPKQMFQRPAQEEGKLPVCNQLQSGNASASDHISLIKHAAIKLQEG